MHCTPPAIVKSYDAAANTIALANSITIRGAGYLILKMRSGDKIIVCGSDVAKFAHDDVTGIRFIGVAEDMQTHGIFAGLFSIEKPK